MDVEFMRSFYQKYYENPQMEAVKDSNEYLEKRNIRYEKEAAFIEQLNLAGNELLSEFEKYLDECADEAEKRILLDDTRAYHLLSMNIMGANWKIYETVQNLSDEEILEEIEQRLGKYLGHIDKENIPDNYYVGIKDLSKYILGVKVNPFAEDWYVALIENLCEEYGLKFYGRSELYKK